MTVINAMRFNANEGAMVADEKSSGSKRAYNVATKIVYAAAGDTVVLAGGSGGADYLSMTQDNFLQEFTAGRAATPKEASNLLSKTASNTSWHFLDGHLSAAHRVTSEALQDPAIAAAHPHAAADLIEMRKGAYPLCKHLAFDMLMLAADGNQVHLYRINPVNAHARESSRPYETLGSGEDAAEPTLSKFVANYSREKRRSIEPAAGLATLISALNNATEQNIGVGGMPQIVAIRNGKIYAPSDDTSKLASEIVFAADEDFVSRDFRDTALEQIVYEGAPFSSTHKSFRRAASNWNKLDLVLRGYRK